MLCAFFYSVQATNDSLSTSQNGYGSWIHATTSQSVLARTALMGADAAISTLGQRPRRRRTHGAGCYRLPKGSDHN